MEDETLELINEFLEDYTTYLKKSGEPTIEVEEVIEIIDVILYP